MTIKIQAKNNAGCTTSYTDRSRTGFAAERLGVGEWTNTTAMGTGYGVTPIVTENGFGGFTAPVGFNQWMPGQVAGTCTNGFGVSPMQAVNGLGTLGMSGFGQSMPTHLGYTAGPAFQAPLPGVNGLPMQAIVQRIAAIDPRLAQVALQIASIDPMFLNTLTKVSVGCPWTAAKFIRVATMDFSLAQSLLKLALMNPQQAVTLASNAMANPVAVKNQLANQAWNGVGSANGLKATRGVAANTIPVDIYDNGVAYVIEAAVPGVSVENVEVNAINGRLVIEAAMVRSNACRASMSSILREKVAPQILRREFAIGNDVLTTDISACIADGILSIELPKKSDLTVNSVCDRETSFVC
jgi:HSP20 family molecular chaperone IbpA